MSSEEAWAVILAAGSGTRLRDACGIPKQYLEWREYPLYWHSALAFAKCPAIKGIVFVFPPEDCEREKERIASFLPHPGLWLEIASGGAERSISARKGLARVPPACAKVLIHDAARPFVTSMLINDVLRALDGSCQGVVPATKATDTIKLVSEDGEKILETLPRNRLRAVQTPQGFETDYLREAYKYAEEKGVTATDDATLLEVLGLTVKTVPGDERNIKITNPSDLRFLAPQKNSFFCAGFGYDVHRFGGNRPLKLGGVAIPCNLEIMAHSDGDVLLHALMDAILSCACLGDIGAHFPDKDPAFENISSAILLNDTLELVRKKGVRLLQADITIVAQKPRLEPWKTDIRNNVARLLDLPRALVNIKATTEERLGFTGREEGIKAYAVVSATREQDYS